MLKEVSAFLLVLKIVVSTDQHVYQQGASSSGGRKHAEELLGPLPSLQVPNDEFGRAARRGKVDVLGLVLKKRIAKLRQKGQTELVFLVDSSASVGSDNFYNEIKFIRKVFKEYKNATFDCILLLVVG